MLENGRSYGFFKSQKGLKQGNHLSLALFIIATKILSRSLNRLIEDSHYRGYGLSKWSPKINHLAYEADTILFGSPDRSSFIMMMRVIRDYKKVSGQKVNKSKSQFFIHDNTSQVVAIRLRRLTRIRQGNFPFI